MCAFHRFEVWEPGAVFNEPRDAFDLAELPDHMDSLLFLAGRQPVFVASQAELTREAVALVTDLYSTLGERRAADAGTLRNFALQLVWSLFAEDVQMLPSRLLTRVVDELLANPERSSADDLGQLFRYLAEPEPRPEHGLYAGAPYVDGGLFARPAAVHLEHDELRLFREACDFDWKRVEPAIFGSLLQGALGRERQWALGAHYTAEADILKVVLPTVVEPWRERIEACRSLRDVEAAQRDLTRYVVLDPACGSGNFLYVAYRELRRLEAALRSTLTRLRPIDCWTASRWTLSRRRFGRQARIRRRRPALRQTAAAHSRVRSRLGPGLCCLPKRRKSFFGAPTPTTRRSYVRT